MARNAPKISLTSGTKRPDFAKLQRDRRDFDSRFSNALYYIHYELGDKRLKTETIKYCKTKKLDNKLLDSLENYRFGLVGRICYIVNNGGQATLEWEKFMHTEIEKLLALGTERKAKSAAKTEKKAIAPVISIQDRLKERAGEVAAEFDGWIDEFILDPAKFKAASYDFHTAMVRADLKAGHVRYIKKFYEHDKELLTTYIAGTDPDINESYSDYTKAQAKKLVKFYDKLFADIDMILETAKVQRKPKRKEVSASKLVEKIKYQKTDKPLGLVSVNPVEIVGAKELWVYNTKTRKIGKYIAIDSVGLSAKGASLTNFTSKSVEKTLRKPTEQLAEFKKSSKVALRKYIDNITTIDTTLKGRLNEHHIILKVIK